MPYSGNTSTHVHLCRSLSQDVDTPLPVVQSNLSPHRYTRPGNETTSWSAVQGLSERSPTRRSVSSATKTLVATPVGPSRALTGGGLVSPMPCARSVRVPRIPSKAVRSRVAYRRPARDDLSRSNIQLAV